MSNEENIKKGMTRLSNKKRTAFALLIAERLMPRLLAFCRDTGVDPAHPLEARRLLWDGLTTDGRPTSRYRFLSEACLENAPDTEDFTHEFTSDALNAFAALGCILDFELDSDIQHLYWVPTLATDSIDQYLSLQNPSAISTPQDEESIANHPLMLQELQRQREDMELLRDLSDILDGEAIAFLRDRSLMPPAMLPLALNRTH